MVEPTQQTETPAGDGATSQDGDGQTSQQPTQDDLVARVTQFASEKEQGSKPAETIDENDVWTDNDFKQQIESIEDPNIREQFQNLRKSLISGANRKHMELADKIKSLESASGQRNTEEWTAERINSLMQDPKFVSAAESVLGGELSTEDDDAEYLPQSVKDKLSKLDEFEKKFQTMESSQMQAWRQSEHKRLQERYKDYDPSRVDEITQAVLEGKAQIGLEDIHKAVTYEDRVKSAYEMGLRDGQSGVQDASQLHTPQSAGNITPQTKVEPQEGENDKNYFLRLGLANLLKSKKRA